MGKHKKLFIVIGIIGVLVVIIIGKCQYDRVQNGTPEAIVKRLEKAVRSYNYSQISGIVQDPSDFSTTHDEYMSYLTPELKTYVRHMMKNTRFREDKMVYEDDTHAKMLLTVVYTDGEQSLLEDHENYFRYLKEHYYSFEKDPAIMIPEYLDDWNNYSELVIHQFEENTAERKIPVSLTKNRKNFWRIENTPDFNESIWAVMTCDAKYGVEAAYEHIAQEEQEELAEKRAHWWELHPDGIDSNEVTDNADYRVTYSPYNNEDDTDDDYGEDSLYLENKSDFENEEDAWDYLDDEPDERE